ncbi:Soluble inorganic pyrophosphatase 6 [Citrus sinensis]|uniref:Soluble inorganic pyrophosphatase 6 n=1 Tax=Citrus sinensis TaxID=2711 RepID=A0ACB8ICU2_CITSI|nr:Soluble inorganic pyrophosphatase 6 [Citrus sinensis]
MAAAKAISQTTSCLLSKTPFALKHKSHITNLCFGTKRVAFPSKRLFSCRAIYNPQVQITEEGQPETLDYRVFFVNNSGKKVSPWHDIPLQLGDGVFNFVVEIPKESSAKMEVATDELYTPIKQDIKKGKLRYYPYNINWNYGLFPQTWEDPSFANSEVEGAFGDNDPVEMPIHNPPPLLYFSVDVVEIGERRRKIGEILKVKPLGALAMIDEGELDWKIVAISLDDPKAALVNDVDDVEKHFPGTLTAIRDWFRDYKIPDGKPANKFGLGNKAADKDYALKVITETNESWAKLVKSSATSLPLLSFGLSIDHVAACIMYYM